MYKETDQDVKDMSLYSLAKSLNSIQYSFSQLYDKNHVGIPTRDDVFMLELLDVIQGIEMVSQIYLRDGKIHPAYCLEKLNWSRQLLQTNINYWGHKLKELEEQNEEGSIH